MGGSGNASQLAALRDRLELGLISTIEESGVNGARKPRVCNTANFYFDHVEAEALVIALDLKGLSVSGGSACQSGATEPSHVLTAMGLSPARARASVRFSLSRLTTAEEVDYALQIIPAAVGRLRTLSPTWRKPEGRVNCSRHRSDGLSRTVFEKGCVEQITHIAFQLNTACRRLFSSSGYVVVAQPD